MSQLTTTTVLPDGSAFAEISFPLPQSHWLYKTTPEGYTPEPPMGLRCGTLEHIQGTTEPPVPTPTINVLKIESRYREVLTRHVKNAVRYGLKCATRNGKEKDFDPDAVVQSTIVGLFGLYTATGLDCWDGVSPLPHGLFGVLNELTAGMRELPPLYCEPEDQPDALSSVSMRD